VLSVTHNATKRTVASNKAIIKIDNGHRDFGDGPEGLILGKIKGRHVMADSIALRYG
jgi:hypothetical protein